VLFLVITTTLFTTFWTNPSGLGTGFLGSLGYWLSQQGVARGTQPWYYYGIVLPIYEYLPLLGGFLGGATYLFKRKHLYEASRTFVPFLGWWAALITLGLTLAGEKMPWLSTHITIPLILLTGWWIGRLIEGDVFDGAFKENRFSTIGRFARLSLVGLLTFLTVRTSAAVNYINYDYSTEFIDYAHGARVKWVLNDIAEISNHTGTAVKIALRQRSFLADDLVPARLPEPGLLRRPA
jgi:predicted membrane-bound mannosyltransferase